MQAALAGNLSNVSISLSEVVASNDWGQRRQINLVKVQSLTECFSQNTFYRRSFKCYILYTVLCTIIFVTTGRLFGFLTLFPSKQQYAVQFNCHVLLVQIIIQRRKDIVEAICLIHLRKWLRPH